MLGMSTLPRMTGLRADLAPHRQWALCRWFYANPVWYYWRPSATHELDTRGRFFELVDPDLRELCRTLNEAGIRTTPSCQGHSYLRERFERIWEVLKGEEELIRTPGLEVKDSENQKPYLFRDPAYRIPWESFEAFYRDAAGHQGVGYIGLIIPEAMEQMIDRVRAEKYASVSATIAEDDDLSRRLGGTVFSVTVNTPDPQTRSIEWQGLTEYIRRSLDHVLTA